MPPLKSEGIEAYRKTWGPRLLVGDDPVVFDFDDVAVTAGSDVGYVAALMRCTGTETNGERVELRFRRPSACGRSAGNGRSCTSTTRFPPA